MTTLTRTERNWKQQRAVLHSTVAFIDGAKTRRAFDAVVVEINRFKAGAELRTVVLRTGASWNRAEDTARCQRLCRRLRAIGVRFNTRLEGLRECDGVFGTMFAHTV